MTLNRLEREQGYLYRATCSDLSSESSAATCSGSSRNGNNSSNYNLYSGFSPAKSQYCSDSDSGIVTVLYDSLARDKILDTREPRMSPKDRIAPLEGRLSNDSIPDSSQTNSEENDFWTYDDQSLLSEESVRRSCQQIYSALRRSSSQKSPPTDANFDGYSDNPYSNYSHEDHNYRPSRPANATSNPYVAARTNSLRKPAVNLSLSAKVNRDVATLPRKTTHGGVSSSKIDSSSIYGQEPEDILRVYARPASVVPVQEHRSNYGQSGDPRFYRPYNQPVATNGPASIVRNSQSLYVDDSSRISLVSMDQNQWSANENGRHFYATTNMFKSQPCLTSSNASCYSEPPLSYDSNPNLPLIQRQLPQSSSDNSLSPRAVKGRRNAGLEAFGTLNERNRKLDTSLQSRIPGENNTTEDTPGTTGRPSRENRCRRSKSFADKLHRGSQSFRSACSAFRRAFSQERIYRPEKQERQQQEFINSTKGHQNDSSAASSSGKELIATTATLATTGNEKKVPDRSPLLPSGRQIVNGIREKLGGGKELFANCSNTYSSKLTVHRRKPRHTYQPPQLVTTHATNVESVTENYDQSDSQPSSFVQDDGHSTSDGWVTDQNSLGCNQRIWGHLIQLNVDGSQVIELSRPRGLHFGFFVARGRVKESRGVFVSRMRDVYTQKILAGILEVGDEILEIEGVDVRNADIVTVNSMMANKQTLLLTVLPYISRKDI